MAVSANGQSWVLLNASPDLPAQLRAFPALQPDRSGPPRNCPIQAVVITGSDIDCALEGTQLVNDTAVIGLSVRDASGAKLFFIPGCAEVTNELRTRVTGSHILFFDGTFWRDNEMIDASLGQKSGTRMGHISVSGEQGSIAFKTASIARKIFIHINNTNPILCDDSPQAEQARAAGWEIAYDGMTITL
jgi:coenzyme PQQ biosynthesis protein B